MFSSRNTFNNETFRSVQPRRSQINLNVRKVFTEPPHVFNNPIANEIYHRLYWLWRNTQFRLFYKDEEADANSLTELCKFEPTERPPNLHELAECTHNRFSQKWLKYLYAKFKNECPSGRMKIQEFKRLFASYMPNRVSDEYFERVFNAFVHVSVSPYPDQLTFKDLVVCLSRLQAADDHTKADWTMRLINGKEADRAQFHEFKDFVQSIYLLTGGNPFTRPADSTLLLPTGSIDERSQIDVNNRAMSIFKELDIQQRGYLTLEDLEKMFRLKQTNVF